MCASLCWGLSSLSFLCLQKSLSLQCWGCVTPRYYPRTVHFNPLPLAPLGGTG